MKNSPLYPVAFALLLFCACKKSNSGATTPSSPYYLSSAVGTSPQRQLIDSFYYDTLHRVDTFTQYIYDTTTGTPRFNTYTIRFVYQDVNSPMPSWYYFYDVPLGGFGDYHLLSYDAESRITKDTSLSGSGSVTYYSYPNNNIASIALPEGVPDNNSLDTLFVTNGNIDKEVLYFSNIPGQPDILGGSANFTFAGSANPAYHPAISKGIGPLLFNYTFANNAAFLDFISKNSWRQSNTLGPLEPFGVSLLNYTITDDSKGRPSKMTGDVSTTPASITFSYY